MPFRLVKLLNTSPRPIEPARCLSCPTLPSKVSKIAKFWSSNRSAYQSRVYGSFSAAFSALRRKSAIPAAAAGLASISTSRAFGIVIS